MLLSLALRFNCNSFSVARMVSLEALMIRSLSVLLWGGEGLLVEEEEEEEGWLDCELCS